MNSQSPVSCHFEWSGQRNCLDDCPSFLNGSNKRYVQPRLFVMEFLCIDDEKCSHQEAVSDISKTLGILLSRETVRQIGDALQESNRNLQVFTKGERLLISFSNISSKIIKMLIYKFIQQTLSKSYICQTMTFKRLNADGVRFTAPMLDWSDLHTYLMDEWQLMEKKQYDYNPLLMDSLNFDNEFVCNYSAEY